MQLSGIKNPFKYAKWVIKVEGITPFFRSLPLTIVFIRILIKIDDEFTVFIYDGYAK